MNTGSSMSKSASWYKPCVPGWIVTKQMCCVYLIFVMKSQGKRPCYCGWWWTGMALSECSRSQDAKLFRNNDFTHPPGVPGGKWLLSASSLKEKKHTVTNWIFCCSIFCVLEPYKDHLHPLVIWVLNITGFFFIKIAAESTQESEMERNLDGSLVRCYQWIRLGLVKRQWLS